MSPIKGLLALVVGHTRNRPGALGVYPIAGHEYNYNSHLADMVRVFGEGRGHQIEVFFRDELELKVHMMRSQNGSPTQP